MHVAGVNGELEAPPLATVWRGLDEAPVALRSDHMDAGDGWPLLFSHDDDVRLFNHFATSLSFETFDSANLAKHPKIGKSLLSPLVGKRR